MFRLIHVAIILLLGRGLPFTNSGYHLMFIWPCIIVIVEENKTILMSLAILFHKWDKIAIDIKLVLYSSTICGYHILLLLFQNSGITKVGLKTKYIIKTFLVCP